MDNKKLAPYYGVVTTERGDEKKVVRTSRTGEGFMRVEAADDGTTYRLEIQAGRVSLTRVRTLWGPAQGEFVDWEVLYEG